MDEMLSEKLKKYMYAISFLELKNILIHILMKLTATFYNERIGPKNSSSIIKYCRFVGSNSH